MKTTANVYLLSSNNNLSYPFIAKNMELGSSNNLCVVTGNSSNSLDLQPQHLYITLPKSDLKISKINKFDFVFNPEYKTVYQWIENADLNFTKIIAEKIIATTDSSLRSLLGGQEVFDFPLDIPKSFIEYYISKYNEGIKVSKVEVELESMNTTIVNRTFNDFELKLTPNNEILIVSCGGSFTDSVITRLTQALDEIEEAIENKFGKISKSDITLDTVNVLLHSKRHEFSDLNAFRRVQNEFVELFSAVTPVEKMYTKEEVVTKCLKMRYDYEQYRKYCRFRPNLQQIAEWNYNWINENL